MSAALVIQAERVWTREVVMTDSDRCECGRRFEGNDIDFAGHEPWCWLVDAKAEIVRLSNENTLLKAEIKILEADNDICRAFVEANNFS